MGKGGEKKGDDGKGKSSGKKGGGKKGGADNFDQIPEPRRQKLMNMITDFLAGDAPSFNFPPTLTSFERLFVHNQAELNRLTSQSCGEGKNRAIGIFRGSGAEGAEGQVSSANYCWGIPLLTPATWLGISEHF